MSARLLLILEDPTYDRYIVKPLIEKLLDQMGRRTARVDVLMDPKLGGVEQVFDGRTWKALLTKYPMIDAFVVAVDRDCEASRDARLQRIAKRISKVGKCFAGVLAIEEVEVWLLAGFKRDLGASWTEVRKECHPKERFFDPFLAAKNVGGVGGGRLAMMQETLKNLRGLLRSCPEIADLQVQLNETP